MPVILHSLLRVCETYRSEHLLGVLRRVIRLRRARRRRCFIINDASARSRVEWLPGKQDFSTNILCLTC